MTQTPQALLLLLLSLLHSSYPDKFCGTSQSNAESLCWQPCGSDSDCCSLSQNCYETDSACGSSVYEGTNHNYCGISWCDAAYTCSTPCEDGVCPDGLWCYGNTPCDSSGGGTTVPELPVDPVNSTSNFCGATLDEAKETCWQPCPRGDEDCCLGLSCFDTAESSNSSTLGVCDAAEYDGENRFYCGKSWCDAAYTCGEPCPSGSHEDCTDGTYCYADIPCSSSRSLPDVFPPTDAIAPAPAPTPSSSSYKYCGVDAGDATDRCWQECQSDADCCFDQYCKYSTALLNFACMIECSCTQTTFNSFLRLQI